MIDVKAVVSHIKRYLLLGILAVIPVALTFFILEYVYRGVDYQLDKILPGLENSSGLGMHVIGIMFVFYLVGILISYFFGKRVEKVSQKLSNLIPHVKSIKDELAFAQKLHESIIPESCQTEKFDVAVDYISCSDIGGDFITYHNYSDAESVFLVGDVTGHGVPAALLVNRLYTELDRYILERKQPGTILRKADQFVRKSFADMGMFFSSFCASIDFDTMTMTYASYGHLPQYLYRKKTHEIIDLHSQTTMLGVGEPENKLYQAQEVIAPGDRLILFTDGIPETVGKKKKRYGDDQFKQAIFNHLDQDVRSFHKTFLEELWEFTEQEYEDDVCLMSVQIK